MFCKRQADKFLHWTWKTSKHKFPTRSLTGVIHHVIEIENEQPLLSTPERQTIYQNVLERLETLMRRSFEGGGAKGIERHVNINKKVLVRDRIRMLIDPETEFFELSNFAGFDLPYGDVPNAGLVTGIGRVAGIYCAIGGNDATVKAGTYFPITVQKSLRMQEISEMNRLPSIYIPDSGGAFLPLQSLLFIYGGRSFYNQAVMSSKGIPQIAVVCGSCTAGGAYNPTMSDEAVIVDGIGKIFLGGPPLVKMAVQEVVTEEELGGAFLHSGVSGCTDYFAQTEPEAFEMCRDIVESLNFQSTVPTTCNPPAHLLDWGVLGSREHLSKAELYAVLASILDQSRFKEFKAFYGPGLITGVGYIEGLMVGIVANWDHLLSSEALKGAHFLDLCGRRDIPVVFLHNSIPSGQDDLIDDQDHLVVKDRAKLITAVSTLNTPKISITLTYCDRNNALLLVRDFFGVDVKGPGSKRWLSIPDMQAVGDSDDSGVVDAFDAAANLLIDNIILPEKTRAVIGHTLRIVNQMKLNKWAQSSNRPVFRM